MKKTQDPTDRRLVLEARPGWTGTRRRTLSGRPMAVADRLTWGSQFAISTMVAGESRDGLEAAIAAHLGCPVEGS